MIPSAETLRRAGDILKEIEQLQGELAGLFGGAPTGKRRGRPPGSGAGTAARGIRKRRKMSSEARARIAEAAKARWARYRAEKKSGSK